MSIRTTEQLAPEQLLLLTAELTKLTTEQPTTAEIEEASTRILPAIQRVLREWISSRHLGQAHAHQAAEFNAAHPHIAAALAPGQAALRHIASIDEARTA